MLDTKFVSKRKKIVYLTFRLGQPRAKRPLYNFILFFKGEKINMAVACFA